MAGPRPIRWLHLSDLHLGCRGEDLWWQVQEVLEKSVREMAQRLGPPDLLLLSGDLTNTGDPKEFKRVDHLLDTLRVWLQADPLTVAVPGNHDLQRPQGLAAVSYRPLERYGQGGDDEDVRLFESTFWDQKDASPIGPLLMGYQDWFRQSLQSNLESRAKLHTSHFPGDFCLEMEIPEAFPLCLVGLNSTWQQYKGGDFERKLLLPLRQFHAALPENQGASPLDIFKRYSRSFLMMHHPPDWLSRRGRQLFFESIYPPDRFDLCLHGHMHEGRTESMAISGGKPRYLFQAPSLFGLEHYGTKEEDRLFGYSWGTLSVEGEVRLWPLKYVRRGSGEGAFVHDDAFPEDTAGVIIRPIHFQAASPSPTPSADFRGYLEALIDRTSHINISGISSAGSVKGALRHPIEKLYTPLGSRGDLEDLRGLIGLPDLLPRHPRLLLEGQPGAGKTTFLRLVACLLARDVLEIECPEGTSWRKRHLGLDGGKPLLPVLLRISDLVPLLTRDEAGLLYDVRHRLLNLLVTMCEGNEHPISRGAWSRRLEEGEAILLFDGLDEVADEGLRTRIFDVFRDAAKHWKKCPFVVTSRPIQTAALREMGFHLAVVEPFGEAEIRTFIDHWVAALYAADTPEALSGEGERYRAALMGTICDLPRIRRLATNPVMLTCLCVIHWNEGHLPEGRSRVYRAVLRWLIAARTDLRTQEGFTDRFAWNAFARLALAMVNAKKGKKAVFDLEAGAVAVDPAVRRQFPGLTAEERRKEARRWLEFECLGSGIVEELSGKRFRFWHLTFQEFLAALQLAWLDDKNEEENSWWPLVRQHLADAQWRETIELLPGCLLDEGGEGRADKLLERVLGLRGDRGDLTTEARVAGIVGRLLQTLSAYQYRPRPEITVTYEAALDRSMAIFMLEGAALVPVKDRIAVAEALGRGGDPRLAPDQDNFLAVSRLKGVRLGKYPVTVEEYQRFVESRGYEETKFWEPAGWALRVREGWEAPGRWEERLETPNRPVTEVSWYEAVAYCRWLTEQRQKGETIRLPTVEEWEKMATPARGQYPWGWEEPDPERANFGNLVRAPTPVGIYPSGAGSSGHLDLAGNVWEWCSDKDIVASASLCKDVRHLKGGGWILPAWSLQTICRDWKPAESRDGSFGFRVAAVREDLDD